MTFTLEETQGGTRRGGAAPRTDDRSDGITIGGAAGAVLDRMAAEARRRQEGEETAATARRLSTVREMEERANVERLIAQERAREQHQRGSTLADRLDQAREQRTLERAQRNIDQRLAMETSYVERMEEMHSSRANAAQLEAEAVTMGFNAMGQGLAKHLQLWAAGEETFSQAAQAMAADTLSSVGQQAIVKGAMEMAEGLSMLAGIYTAPLAPGHFAAGAAFLAVGALATAGGAALAPSPATPSAGGGGARPSRGAESFGSDRPREPKGGDGITVIHMYYGPTINGRGTSESEAGARVLRLTDATARRQQRPRE